ncbi:MAG: hypothetical protein HIU83_09595 [Proteobacteria bacterium]|nr:hypothetical protein [Pseudomonadota bacterium]
MPDISIQFSEQIMLEKCREVELRCKELYEYFAELYSDNGDAAYLWNKTAMEEQNHADQFTLLLKLRKGLACMVTVNSAKLESLQTQMRTVLEKVKATPPKLADALYSAIKLEKHLAEFHLGCVVEFEENSHKRLFDAMMTSDQEHIASLQAAYDKLKDDQDQLFVS